MLSKTKYNFTLTTNTDSKLKRKRKDPELHESDLVQLKLFFILGSVSSHSNWSNQTCMNFTSSICYAIWLDDGMVSFHSLTEGGPEI